MHVANPDLILNIPYDLPEHQSPEVISESRTRKEVPSTALVWFLKTKKRVMVLGVDLCGMLIRVRRVY